MYVNSHPEAVQSMRSDEILLQHDWNTLEYIIWYHAQSESGLLSLPDNYTRRNPRPANLNEILEIRSGITDVPLEARGAQHLAEECPQTEHNKFPNCFVGVAEFGRSIVECEINTIAVNQSQFCCQLWSFLRWRQGHSVAWRHLERYKRARRGNPNGNDLELGMNIQWGWQTFKRSEQETYTLGALSKSLRREWSSSPGVGEVPVWSKWVNYATCLKCTCRNPMCSFSQL